MTSQIKERTVEEIQEKLDGMNTDLNKLSYLEIALKESAINADTKRFLLDMSATLYEKRKMYEKAGKAMANKASMDVLLKDRIESYLKSAELYAQAGKVNYAEDIFLRAHREATKEQQGKIELAKKNIYSRFAKELYTAGKKAHALKFYEKLIRMQIDPAEKEIVKKRLIEIYTSLGMFQESKLAEGL